MLCGDRCWMLLSLAVVGVLVQRGLLRILVIATLGWVFGLGGLHAGLGLVFGLFFC